MIPEMDVQPKRPKLVVVTVVDAVVVTDDVCVVDGVGDSVG